MLLLHPAGIVTLILQHLEVSEKAAGMHNGCDCQRDRFGLFVYLQWGWFIPGGGNEGGEMWIMIRSRMR